MQAAPHAACALGVRITSCVALGQPLTLCPQLLLCETGVTAPPTGRQRGPNGPGS